MTSDDRAIELEIEVSGTPDEVWQAIATGPGITSWYVPHTVEEREGGSVTASFGPGPEMQVEGRVVAWDPPRRFAMDGGEGAPGPAFEWTVASLDGGTSVVRLVNSGFGSGAEWDDQYDGMTQGWRIFMANLALHMRHFAGQRAQVRQAAGMWQGPQPQAWKRLLAELGVPGSLAIGDPVRVGGGDTPALVGSVAGVGRAHALLVLTAPAPGTAFLAVEGSGDQVAVSVWSYMYGDGAADAAAADVTRWNEWLASRGVSTDPR